MFAALAKSTPQSSRAMFYVQRRGFGSIPTLSEERYMALWKKTKKDDEVLRRLKQDPYSNPNTMSILQKRIDKNRRFLMTCQISNQVDLSDDPSQ